MSEELKPCPKCGADAALVSYAFGNSDTSDTWFAHCSNNACFVTGDSYSTRLNSDARQRAIDDWNHQPVIDGLLERAKVIVALLDRYYPELMDKPGDFVKRISRDVK